MFNLAELVELLTSEEARAAVRDAARNFVIGTGAKTFGGTVVERLFRGERREVEKAFRDALTATLRQYDELEEIQAPLARWLGRPPASDAFLRILVEPAMEPDPAEFQALLDDTPFDPGTFPVPVSDLVSSLRNFFLVALFRNPKTRNLHEALSQHEQGMEHRWMLRRQGAVLSAQHRMEEMLQEVLARLPATQDYRERRLPFMAENLPEHFVERRGLFEKLRGQLLGTHGGSVTITTALHGAGGFGKTTLALALCHDPDIRQEFSDGILWVTLGETPDILGKLAELHASLTGERPPFRSVEDAAVHFAEALGGKRCLMVLDDIWKQDHLTPFRRGGPSCVRLITSRNRAILSGAAGVDVDEMSDAEAVGMLAARIGSPPGLNEAFAALARRLGEWPLLLDLAAAALQERVSTGDSIEGALLYLNQALDRRGTVAFDQSDTEARNLAVARSLGASLGLLGDQQRCQLLEMSIFPEDVNIPLDVLATLWGVDSFEAEELLQRFHRLSLLRFEPVLRIARLHDVMRTHYASELSTFQTLSALHERLLGAWGDFHQLPNKYAWQWVAYHLQEAGQTSVLCSLLLDYTWLSAKLRATSIQALLSDYNGLPGIEHQVLQDALRLSAHVLSVRKDELCSQLAGRLGGIGIPEIEQLLIQAMTDEWQPWLIPVTNCLEAPSRGLRRTLGDGHARVDGVVMAADGRRAVSISRNKVVHVWDLELGSIERSLTPGTGGWVSDVAISGDFRKGVLGGQNGSVQFWNFETGHLLSETIQGGPIICVGISAEGTRAVSASRDRTIRIWELTGYTLQYVLEIPSPAICVAVTNEGSHALTLSEDRVLRVWDLERGELLTSADTAGAVSTAIRKTAEGTRAVTCSYGSVCVWEFDDYRRIVSREIPHVTGSRCIALSPDGTLAILGTERGAIHLCDLEAATILRTLRGHERQVNAIGVGGGGQRIVSASEDGTLKLWDLTASTASPLLNWHEERVKFVRISANGARAVSGSSDGTLRVWDLRGGELLNTLSWREEYPEYCELTHDGRRFVSVAHGQADVWDLETGTLVLNSWLTEGSTADYTKPASKGGTPSRQIPQNRAVGYAMPANGTRLFVIREHGGAELWNLATGDQLRELADGSVRFTSIFPARDSHWIIGVRDDGHRQVWNADTGDDRQIHVIAPPDQIVATPPNGRLSFLMQSDGETQGLDLDTELAIDAASRQTHPTSRTHYRASDESARVKNNGFWEANSVGATIQLSNSVTGSSFGRFTADSAITSVTVGADGHTVVAGDAVGRVIILRTSAFVQSGLAG